MATIKSYTDLEQSKKLAEILPLESADMMHQKYETVIGDNYGYAYRIQPFFSSDTEGIPCWSLASLLDAIPKHIKDYNVLRIDISENDTSIWYDEVGFGVNSNLPDITMEYAVDACVEMIVRLHELKML
jgi:hypothetical protein